MAGMEEALTALLLADAGVSALVGTRVHWLRLPAQVHGRPYLNLQVVGDVPGYHMAGPSGLVSTRVQADSWGETALAAKQVDRAVKAALSGWSGTQSGIVFQGVFALSTRDGLEQAAGRDRRLFRVSTDLEVNWHKE